ncbi:MAG: hypothetical protein IPK93_02645 [Solirubrobacterales bacterium]|nr:hypothetical protein [Solirubrobacterales bacterium]
MIVAGIDYLLSNFILYVILMAICVPCYFVYLVVEQWLGYWKDAREAKRKQRASDEEEGF